MLYFGQEYWDYLVYLCNICLCAFNCLRSLFGKVIVPWPLDGREAMH